MKDFLILIKIPSNQKWIKLCGRLRGFLFQSFIRLRRTMSAKPRIKNGNTYIPPSPPGETIALPAAKNNQTPITRKKMKNRIAPIVPSFKANPRKTLKRKLNLNFEGGITAIYATVTARAIVCVFCSDR